MGEASQGASTVRLEKGKVVFVVRGHHSAADALRCSREMFALLAPLQRTELIVDLSDMSGFSRDTREVWSERLAEFKRHIHTLTLVGGNPIARMTSSAVCLFAGITMRTAASVRDAITFSP